MIINKIKINGSKPTEYQLKQIIGNLMFELQQAGYLTDVNIMNTQALKVGMHMCCFKLDLNKHDYNTRFSPFQKERRTRFPTWNQRVQFNDIVNDVLDSLEVECKVKSGPFLVREGALRLDESDWNQQKPEYMIVNEHRGFFVI